MEDELYNPYIAAITGKNSADQEKFFTVFYGLPQPLKDALTSSETTAAIKNLFEKGLAPQGYEVAVAKIVALTAVGDIPFVSIPELLSKLGLPEAQVPAIAHELETILRPIIAARGKAAIPEMKEMPPLNRPTETGPQPIAGQQGNARNIIDLRKQQPNA